ncbi:metal-dependent hydrolase [Bacillus sp. JJ1562]|uniref:metal-dependent hydrolase n=1 Tax=Bacillus sp. JJ1562 TaxID=3122960 RepID=UPI003002A865
MDTFSHVVIGLGIGALAQIDPVVSENQNLSQAILLGTVIGSNAPDFDFIYRLRGKGNYFRHHRGLSHSLPVLPLWAILVSGILYPLISGTDFFHLFFWTFLAVILHVLFDLFNVHGTQIVRPFSQKWVAFDAVPLIDPFILTLHFLGFGLLFYYQPGITFLTIYAFVFLYLGVRTYSTVAAKRHLNDYFINAVRIKLVPRISLSRWDVIIETKENFLFGTYSEKTLEIEHTHSKKVNFPSLVSESQKDQSISDFLSCATYAYPFVVVRKNGYFVYWKDLRFRTNKFFPYLAIQFISPDLKCKNSYIGKVSSLRHYKKVIRSLTDPSQSKK